MVCSEFLNFGMHYFRVVPFIFCLFFIACDSPTDEQLVTSPDSIPVTDTVATTLTANSDSVLNGKEIGYYLTHPDIPEKIKSLYRSRNDRQSAWEINLVNDSIYSTNEETQPFYFLVTSVLLRNLDGAYSEPVGIKAKDYVETHSLQFVQLFTHEPLLNDSLLGDWAKLVSGEIKISDEGHEQDAAVLLKQTMELNCKNATKDELSKLNTFTAKVYAECTKK